MKYDSSEYLNYDNLQLKLIISQRYVIFATSKFNILNFLSVITDIL